MGWQFHKFMFKIFDKFLCFSFSFVNNNSKNAYDLSRSLLECSKVYLAINNPENDFFIPLLARNSEGAIASAKENALPGGLKIHSSIIWLYYDDIREKHIQDIVNTKGYAQWDCYL